MFDGSKDGCIFGTLGDMEYKAVFVLGENHFRKCFSGNEAVLLVRKILFSGN